MLNNIGYLYLDCGALTYISWLGVQQQLAVTNLGSASSIVHFIVGGTNTLLNALSLPGRHSLEIKGCGL